MATRYQRGAEHERYVKKRYEEAGYFVVRAAGSHGKADLVAISDEEVLLIQCKLKGAISKEERQQFTELVNRTQRVGLLISGRGKTYHEETINPDVPELQESRGSKDDEQGPWSYERVDDSSWGSGYVWSRGENRKAP